MLNTQKKKKQQSSASARVVDGKLILSLPDASTPVVWQMDLTQTKASALEVRHNQDKTVFTLTLKTPKGETLDIAPFDSREFAVEGLMAASFALENAHGQIRDFPAECANDQPRTRYIGSKPKSGAGKKWLIAFGALFALFILLNIWTAVTPIRPMNQDQMMAQYGGVQTIAPQERTGVAVSADEFLNAQ